MNINDDSKLRCGDEIIIKGVINRAGNTDSIYTREEEPSENSKFDASAYTEGVGTEAVNQATQSGIQAVVTHVQTQVQNIGMSGLIAIGGGGAFQVEHMIDHSGQAFEKAVPMIQELVETGTIKDTIPVGHSKHGQDIPKVDSFFGVKVGEARKQAIEEKNMPEELKEAGRVMTRSARSPGVNDFGEKEASMQ
jgi:hypothetical protein